MSLGLSPPKINPSGVLTINFHAFSIYPPLTPSQTGYGYMAYLEAVKNGANGVECSLGFPDGAGQVLYYMCPIAKHPVFIRPHCKHVSIL